MGYDAKFSCSAYLLSLAQDDMRSREAPNTTQCREKVMFDWLE